MLNLAVDTNILIYAEHANSPECVKAREFLQEHSENQDFVLCELNLIELYMALRNPAIFPKPLSAAKAHDYCSILRSNHRWQIIDYVPEVAIPLWDWTRTTKSGFRRIIDARIAFTLLHHGVSEFTTANVKDFKEFGFSRVWNPLA